MKLERTLFKISISETIILSIFMLTVLNGVIFLFLLATGSPRFLLYDTAWILQIVFPIVYAVFQSLINRNGVLKLTYYQDLIKLTKQIESLLFNKGYIVIDSKTVYIKYVKKTKLGKFLNQFFKENINVQVTENGVSIFAKKNVLDSIFMKLKYVKTNG